MCELDFVTTFQIVAISQEDVSLNNYTIKRTYEDHENHENHEDYRNNVILTCIHRCYKEEYLIDNDISYQSIEGHLIVYGEVPHTITEMIVKLDDYEYSSKNCFQFKIGSIIKLEPCCCPVLIRY